MFNRRSVVGGSPRKYGNKKIVIGGDTFDSKREYERWLVLRDAERRGEISNLRRQVKYELLPSIYKDVEVQLKTKTKIVRRLDMRGVDYTCDFAYTKDGAEVVEDVKISPDVLPKEYILKEKMFYQRYGIKIHKVYKSGAAIG